MNIEIHGTGRAAGALAIAASRADHAFVGVHGRSGAVAKPFESHVTIADGQPVLRNIAVSDRAIGQVAESLVGAAPVPTVHVSGAEPVTVLEALASSAQTGSFHPLQTLPTPEAGANRLAGAWIGITAQEPLAGALVELAESMGCRPFFIADEQKALYHAAAAAVANFTLASMAIADVLYKASGVPFEASRPLVEAIAANAYDLGPREALTGPIARGDVETVAKQVEAVRVGVPNDFDAFLGFARATALVAGTSDEMGEALQ